MSEADRYAKVLYESICAQATTPCDPWNDLPEYWRQLLRVEAQAVVDAIAEDTAGYQRWMEGIPA